jgi:hypothetical protein
MCLSLEICARPTAGLGLSFNTMLEAQQKLETSNENHPGFHRGGDFDVS